MANGANAALQPAGQEQDHEDQHEDATDSVAVVHDVTSFVRVRASLRSA